MSKPRQILPGSSYLITRRCSERRFFLRPDAFITQALIYCLAFAAKRFGILVHCAVSLSNHWHLVVTDPDGKICRFVAFAHVLIAKCVNMFRGRWEGMWSSERCSIVRLETAEDVLDKILYCLFNPVDAELVRSGSAWPGMWLGPARLGRPILVRRPAKFFRKVGRTPEQLKLEITKPPGFEAYTDEQFVALVQERLMCMEAEKAAEMKSKGKHYLGPAAILRQNWRSAPKTLAPRRNLNPHIAARDPDVRVAALRRLIQFWADYHVACNAWRRGKRRTRFPAGTYWMRVRFGVRCHAPPN